MENKPSLTGISLTEYEREIVQTASAERGLFNFSATLRQIIREWDEMRKANQAATTPTQPQPPTGQ